ncbi:MAG: DUF1493 family protein [Planctomycetota bacterium]
MARQATIQKVFAFLLENWPLPKGRGAFTLEMDLWADLGMAGDDVDEFFLGFAGEFGVPAERIDVEGCFPGECISLREMIFGLRFRPARRCRVRDLVQAAETGDWPALERLEGAVEEREQPNTHG